MRRAKIRPNEGAKPLLPALSASPTLRMVTFAALYFAQGLPMGMLGVALPAAMAERGFSPAAIGSLGAVSLLLPRSPAPGSSRTTTTASSATAAGRCRP